MILPRGQQIFSSLSMVNSSFHLPKRELITLEFTFTKNVVPGFKLFTGAQVYFDPKGRQLDYRLAVSATFVEKLFLSK